MRKPNSRRRRRARYVVAARPATGDAIATRTIALHYESGWTMTMAFMGTRVRWTTTDANLTSRSGDDAYDVVQVRPGVFFLEFVVAHGSAAYSHILDRKRGRALSIWSEVVEVNGKTGLRELLAPARLAGHVGDYEGIGETRELLGKRLVCEYGREAALRHVYVNSSTVVWQWLRSPPALALEVGIEAMTMWKIRDRLYLISTRGEDSIQLTVLLDLERMSNIGRLFGRSHRGVVREQCVGNVTSLEEFTHAEGLRASTTAEASGA